MSDSPAPAPDDAASEPPGPAAPAPVRRRPGWVDMAISMLVLVGIVFGLLLLVPQPEGIEQPGVDPVVAAAEVAGSLDFAPVALAPAELGDGWEVDYARVEEAAGLTQWRVGYFTPGGRRIDLEQTVGATNGWLTRAQGADRLTVPGPSDSVVLGGSEWLRISRADGRTAFATDRGDGSTVMLSVVAADALDDLEELAESLPPAAGTEPGADYSGFLPDPT